MVAGINGMTVSSSVLPGKKVSVERKGKTGASDISGGYAVSLNKSFSKELVEYAHTLYIDIINLKDSSKEIGYFIEEYKTVEDKIGNLAEEKKEQVVSMFQDKVKDFVDDYEVAYDFASKQGHSQALLDFSADLFQITGDYEQMLEKLGVVENGDNSLEINFDIQSDKNFVSSKMAAIKEFASKIYNSTQNILRKPMSAHMNFKGLKYYYNYKIDKYQSNTFSLIEAGMIIDVAV